MTLRILPPRHAVFDASVRSLPAPSTPLSELSYSDGFRPSEAGILAPAHSVRSQEPVLTRSRKTAKRLAPDAAAMLAAHVQGRFEAEKARIARRLHGDVAGMLAAARMDLSRMASTHPGDDDLRDQVARVDQILDAVIHNARSEMQRLHPALLDHFGLSAALRHLVEQACRAAGAEYTFELPDSTDAGVPGTVALAAFRVVETLLEARTLRRVQLRSRDAGSHVLLQVEVDGEVEAPAASSQDLLALRAWLEALGAVWKMADRGPAVEVTLELPRPQAATTAAPVSRD